MFKSMMLVAAAIALLAGCAPSKFKTYEGPEVTDVRIFKGSRKMYLMHGEGIIRAYDIGLGFRPMGHKVHEGDGRTPEGTYFVTKRNPDSKYHLSIGIDYPRPADVARAQAMGLSPGGDIFIHGRGTFLTRGLRDWTAGCIAITNQEMEDVFAMVADGTPVHIFK